MKNSERAAKYLDTMNEMGFISVKIEYKTVENFTNDGIAFQ